jgi:peptide/nickel transport system substrate-binding protein
MASMLTSTNRDNLKVVEGAENRTVFIGMDQFSEQLPNSDLKSKNPLKDVRVHKALYQAIDIEAIKRSSYITKTLCLFLFTTK